MDKIQLEANLLARNALLLGMSPEELARANYTNSCISAVCNVHSQEREDARAQAGLWCAVLGYLISLRVEAEAK